MAARTAYCLWRKQTPDRFSRSRGWWLAKAWTWNFNREVLNNIWMGCANALLTNYWHVNGCAGYGYRTQQDDLTRGGMQAENPQSNWTHFGCQHGRAQMALVRYVWRHR